MIVEHSPPPTPPGSVSGHHPSLGDCHHFEALSESYNLTENPTESGNPSKPPAKPINNSNHHHSITQTNATPTLSIDDTSSITNTSVTGHTMSNVTTKSGLHRYFAITSGKNGKPHLTPNTPVSNPNNSTNANQKRKISPNNTLQKPAQKQIILHNRFGPLSEFVDEPKSDHDLINTQGPSNKSNNECSPTKSTKKKITKPPPIYVRIDSFSSLLKELKSISKKYFITAVQKGQINETKVQFEEVEDFQKFTNILENKKVQHYTFQLKSNRGQIVFIRGIDNSTDSLDIKNDLEKQGFKTKSISNIRDKNGRPAPLFKIELEPSQTNDRTAIFKIVYILDYKVKVEPPHNKQRIIQCGRCFEYGHTHNYCKLNFVCPRCSGPHEVINCNQPDIILCSNCNQNHPPYDKSCIVYKTIQNNLKSKISERKSGKPAQTFTYNDKDFLPLQPEQSTLPKPPQWPQQPHPQQKTSTNENLLNKLLDKLDQAILVITETISVIRQLLTINNVK